MTLSLQLIMSPRLWLNWNLILAISYLVNQAYNGIPDWFMSWIQLKKSMLWNYRQLLYELAVHKLHQTCYNWSLRFSASKRNFFPLHLHWNISSSGIMCRANIKHARGCTTWTLVEESQGVTNHHYALLDRVECQSWGNLKLESLNILFDHQAEIMIIF